MPPLLLLSLVKTLHTNDQRAVLSEAFLLGPHFMRPHQILEAVIQKQNSEMKISHLVPSNVHPSGKGNGD